MTLQVRNWSDHFETSESNKRKGPLEWVALPTRRDGKRYRRVARHPNGTAIFGCWCAILEVAARCKPRGVLVDEQGHPLDADDLEDLTGFPASMFTEAIDLLTSQRIGWLEQVDTSKTDGILLESAGVPADDGSNVANLPEDAGGRRNMPGRAVDPVLPNTNTNRTRQNNTEHEQADASTSDQSAGAGTSGSDSDEADADEPVERRKARQRFRLDCSKLWAPRGARSSDGKGDQRLSDDTSTTRLFDTHIWPDETTIAEGMKRVEIATALVSEAGKRRKPMAWLTHQVQELSTEAVA